MDESDPSTMLDALRVARWERLALPYLVERRGLDPEKPAVVIGGQARTYRELRERSWRVANGLLGLGVEPKDRVALISPNAAELVEIELGIGAVRAVIVPLDRRLPAAQLAALLRRSGARAGFVDQALLNTVRALRRSGEVPALRTIVALHTGPGDLDYEELCLSASGQRPPHEERLSDLHEIVFTPGTTGEPKAVVWSNGTVLWHSLQQIADYQLGPQHSAYIIGDICCTTAHRELIWPFLHQGGTVHLRPSVVFDAESVLRYMAEHQITHAVWPPAMLEEIVRERLLHEYDVSCLRMILSGGQRVSPVVSNRIRLTFPNAEFVHSYGLAEAGGSVSFLPARYVSSKAQSAGLPSMYASIKIVDRDGYEVGDGADGEILVLGPSVAAGYWDDMQLSKPPLAGDWLHTGDVGHVDSEGFLYVRGRRQEVIVSRGRSLFPDEIEEALRAHPAIADVAVIGVPHEQWGEAVCAIVEPVPETTVLEPEIIDYCNQRLSPSKSPTLVRFTTKLPRTADGAAMKFVLRERYAYDAEQASEQV